MTVTDEIGDAFSAALVKDAGAAPDPVTAEAPPRRSERDPEAPHGRAEDGTPLAPFGTKADGTPRVKPAGPGRPSKDDQPRTAPPAPPAPKDEEDGYAADLLALGQQVWVAMSMLRGGRILGVRLPDVRPYAMVWHQQLPAGAAAWDQAARQSPQVRAFVQRYTGNGSSTWVLGVGLWGVALVGSCIELAKAPAEFRATAADANDKMVSEFIAEQIEAATGIREDPQ